MPTDEELQFYYYGFYTVLKRYRYATLLGWLVVVIGFVSFTLAWGAERDHGVIDTLLACGCALAGLVLVQNSVASLSSYVTVPFNPSSANAEGTSEVPVVQEIEALMKEVEEGGWQEAYAAIKKLKEMESRYNLPHLNR